MMANAIFLAALAACLFGLVSAASAGEFHVATGGADADPGTKERPFATIARARDAVREKIAAGLAEDVTVWIRGGVYRIAEPLRFGPEDSGTDRFSVTYAAAPGETVVISGGRAITGWKDKGDGTWSAEIPDAKAGAWTFRELFVGGRRAVRARHPNDGYFRVEKAGADRRTNFQYRGGDLRAWPDLASVELVFLHDWCLTRTPVKAIDEATRTLTVPYQIGGASSWAAIDHFEPHPRYFVENAAALLDAPGEWHLDAQAGVVRYRPRPEDDPAADEFVAPVAPQLVVVRGTSERPVRNLRFEGLRFRHAAWPIPEGVYWGRQAACFSSAIRDGQRVGGGWVPAAIEFERAEDCAIAECEIASLGGSGVWFGSRCRRCRIEASAVRDVSGNGVMVGEGQERRIEGRPWWQAAPEEVASGNVVRNCLVERCGRQFYGAVGVWVGLAEKTAVVRNEIRDLPYTGVSVGWMWNPTPTPCRENLVEANHIHHVMQVLSDGGGIYTLGLQPGSALRANLIHDVPANTGRAESNGMFLDEGTTDLVIEENVIYGVARSPLRFHKATTNLVRRNVLVVGKGVPHVRYNATDAANIRQEENTVAETAPPEALDAAARRAGPEPPHRAKFGL